MIRCLARSEPGWAIWSIRGAAGARHRSGMSSLGPVGRPTGWSGAFGPFRRLHPTSDRLHANLIPWGLKTTLGYAEKVRSQFLSLRQLGRGAVFSG
jgi:hypothetical protein